MPKEFLEIVITADNAKAIAELKQTAAGIEGVAVVSQKATAKMAEMAKNTNQAANALQNVGRVAGDLPFGFMGIQNNLNPLLESFQRLKAESGSSKEAIKALGASLIGAGGLGLALSLVSSAILIYQNGIMGFNKKTQEAKDAVNEFSDSGVLKAVQSVRSLEREIQLAKDGIISKDGVIQHYNETIGKTTGLVDSVNEAEIKLKNNAGDYIKMQLAKAAANLALADAAKLELEIAELQTKKTQEFGKSGKFGAGISMAPGFVPGQGGDMGMAARVAANQAEKSRLDADLKKKLADKKAIYEKFSKQNEEIFKQHPEWNFFDDTRADKGTAKVKEIKPPKFDGSKMFQDRLNDEIKFFNDSYAIWKQNEDKKNAEILRGRKEREQAEQFDVQIMRDSGKVIYDNAQAKNQEAAATAEAARKKRLEEINEKLAAQKQLATSIGTAFQNMFTNVANAKDPFEALGESIKQLVIDLAAAAAKMAIIEGIMTLLFPERAAAKKAGKLLGGIIGGGFAKGGVSYGPQGGHMELLHGTEAVLTPAQMSGLVRNSMNAGAIQSMGSNGGQDMNISGEFVARGQDLVLALQRSNYSLNLRRG